MKIMVVGGGGREHAIIKKLKENKRVETVYALPGNGGIAKDAVCVPIGAKDIDAIVAFATEKGIDFAVVAPDDPLVLGAVDALEGAGIACFGPVADAAIIEGSKVFSKELMKKYNIPTARYEVFDNAEAALAYLKTAPMPSVIKADGLALGKGVIIAQTLEEAEEAVRRLRRAGYDNLSVDVIFGVAGFGDTLTETLRRAIALDVEHISAYHLTVEERTRLGLLVKRGEYMPIVDEESEREFLAVHTSLEDAGYEHYEVSNFAKRGRRAEHNSAYWTGVEYLGIGPGAHSFTGDERRWCVSTAKQYSEGVITFEDEQLSERDRLNEYVMTSLRRVEGIDLDYVEQRFGCGERRRIECAAKEWVASGVVRAEGSTLAISVKHFLVSDAVIETLFA